MYKAERESARPVFLQGGGFFLTPGCPVSSGAGAHAGQGLRKGPLQTLQASWASGRPRHAHPTDVPQLGFQDAAGSFCGNAHGWQGPCRAGPWDRGTVGTWASSLPPSLSDPPSGGPLGGLGGLLLEEGEPGYRPQIGGSCRLCTSSRGRLEPSFGSFLGHPGCSIWSRFLFFFPLFLFS